MQGVTRLPEVDARDSIGLQMPAFTMHPTFARLAA
jgi:hypothetical protein